MIPLLSFIRIGRSLATCQRQSIILAIISRDVWSLEHKSSLLLIMCTAFQLDGLQVTYENPFCVMPCFVGVWHQMLIWWHDHGIQMYSIGIYGFWSINFMTPMCADGPVTITAWVLHHLELCRSLHLCMALQLTQVSKCSSTRKLLQLKDWTKVFLVSSVWLGLGRRWSCRNLHYWYTHILSYWM